MHVYKFKFSFMLRKKCASTKICHTSDFSAAIGDALSGTPSMLGM